MKSLGKSVLAAIVLAFGWLATPPVAADEDPFRGLATEWWQWVLSIPTPENPLLDPTGAECMVGQHAEAPSAGFALDVTYHLIVVPTP